MEAGAGGVLANTAIAKANNSPTMAYAMKLGVTAGRAAFCAGKMEESSYAHPSSPLLGLSQ
jgi:thiazole synthase